jgi:hypothetical protein
MADSEHKDSQVLPIPFGDDPSIIGDARRPRLFKSAHSCEGSGEVGNDNAAQLLTTHCGIGGGWPLERSCWSSWPHFGHMTQRPFEKPPHHLTNVGLFS